MHNFGIRSYFLCFVIVNKESSLDPKVLQTKKELRFVPMFEKLAIICGCDRTRHLQYATRLIQKVDPDFSPHLLKPVQVPGRSNK
jgi:hypothetical protein